MIRTILYIIFILIFFILTLFTFPFYFLLRLFRAKQAAKKFANATSSFMAWIIFSGTGSKVEVQGRENFPSAKNLPVCVISNHQSLYDIPLLVWKTPFPIGFIAKKSLGRIPVLNLWMMSLRCVLIDRKSPRSSIKAIEKGVQSIKAGYPMLIFPEGTRSRGRAPREFKKGSLKLATRSGATIVPVTVDGAYQLFELHGKVRPGKVKMTIHKPIDVSVLSAEEIDGLAERLRKLICADIKAVRAD